MAAQGPSGNVYAPVAEPKDALEELFTYHKATPEQELAYISIRQSALSLARAIDANCSPGPEWCRRVVNYGNTVQDRRAETGLTSGTALH